MMNRLHPPSIFNALVIEDKIALPITSGRAALLAMVGNQRVSIATFVDPASADTVDVSAVERLLRLAPRVDLDHDKVSIFALIKEIEREAGGRQRLLDFHNAMNDACVDIALEVGATLFFERLTNHPSLDAKWAKIVWSPRMNFERKHEAYKRLMRASLHIFAGFMATDVK